MNRRLKSKSAAMFLACATVGAFLLATPARSFAATGAGSNAVSPGNSGGGGGGMGAGPMTSPPTSQPTDATPTKTIQELSAEYTAAGKKLAKIMTPAVASDPAKRAEAAPQAIPLVYHMVDLADQIGATGKLPPATVDQLRQGSFAMLYLLDDAPTVTKVKTMKASDDATRQLNGTSIELNARWIAAGTSKDEAGKVVDDLETLAKAHPDSSRLTMLTLGFVQTSRVPELRSRLVSLITDVMTDPYATKIKGQIAAQKQQEDQTMAKQKAFMDKPFVIAAKTVDGKDFTTADLKGKVVLVDFWATWCGPCKAGLPHVVETYNKYHDQGLEIVGISNDYSAKDLTDFTPANGMPWTQLFDADAAANHKWNPLSSQYGVNGIPCMFLIDKKGILRSVTARAEMDDLIPKLLAE